MKFIFKIFLFLFLASTLLVVGYQAIKYARDTVRIWNAQTLQKTLDLYQVKKGYYPNSENDKNISKLLFEEKFINKEIRDPVFTSATVIMDEYANALLKLFDKITMFASPELKGKMAKLQELSSEAISPDYVIAYISDTHWYEVSVKLESFFLKEKMIEDGGNDDNRYEIGNKLEFDTSINVINGTEIKANDVKTSIVR